MLSREGLVWAVSGAALPLKPGQSLTLTIGDAYYMASHSAFSGTVLAGTPVYAQVDSANTMTNYGAVLEADERSGRTYNNISGPVYPNRALQVARPTKPSGGGVDDLPIRP